jgi:hypothetical protein
MFLYPANGFYPASVRQIYVEDDQMRLVLLTGLECTMQVARLRNHPKAAAVTVKLTAYQLAHKAVIINDYNVNRRGHHIA